MLRPYNLQYSPGILPEHDYVITGVFSSLYTFKFLSRVSNAFRFSHNNNAKVVITIMLYVQ